MPRSNHKSRRLACKKCPPVIRRAAAGTYRAVPPVNPVEHIGELRRRDRYRTSAGDGQINRPLSSRFEYSDMPIPSCQMILIRSPPAPRTTYQSPACGSRPSACCTCKASPFMPRRMSLRPTARHTRTPKGTGIIAAPGPPAPAAASRPGTLADANTIPPGQPDLDHLAGAGRCRPLRLIRLTLTGSKRSSAGSAGSPR